MTGIVTRRWSDNTIAERQHRFIDLEATNDVQRWYESAIVVGLLQTRDYATAVLTSCLEFAGHPDDNVEEAVAARLERQSVWRESGARAHILLAEQALYTTVGTPAIMAGQLSALVAVREGTTLGIIPRDKGFIPCTSFGLHRDRVVIETLTGGVDCTGESDAAAYEAVFVRIAEQSVTGDAASELIEEAINHHTAR